MSAASAGFNHVPIGGDAPGATAVRCTHIHKLQLYEGFQEWEESIVCCTEALHTDRPGSRGSSEVNYQA